MTPTQRTLAALKARGWTVGVVERWIPGACIRQDLFGWIDMLALDPRSRAIVAVQSTGEAWAAHKVKLLTERRAAAALWLHCGGRAELWGWRGVKVKGRVVKRPRVAELYLDPYGALGLIEWRPDVPDLWTMGA